VAKILFCAIISAGINFVLCNHQPDFGWPDTKGVVLGFRLYGEDMGIDITAIPASKSSLATLFRARSRLFRYRGNKVRDRLGAPKTPGFGYQSFLVLNA
jgi:hypothetical protein